MSLIDQAEAKQLVGGHVPRIRAKISKGLAVQVKKKVKNGTFHKTFFFFLIFFK